MFSALATLAFLVPAPPASADATRSFYLGCDASLIPGDVMPDGSVVARKMETSLFAGPTIFGGCWAHVAYQQYFLGATEVYGLRSAVLNLIATESELAPSTDVGVEADAAGLHAGAHVRIHVETSLDGKSWSEVATGQYNLARVNGFASKVNIPGLSGGGNGTYVVESGPLSAGPLGSKDWFVLTFTAADTPFRFLRAHMGGSATGGLSGYLDYLFGTVTVTDLGPAPAPTRTPREHANFDCGKDILEDFAADHPCWYGDPCQVGVPGFPCDAAGSTPSYLSHWNGVSTLHTYALGDAQLTRIRGTATLAPFRLNDPGQDAAGALAGHVNVQVSADGYTWTDIGSVPVDYDRTGHAFDFPSLGGVEARFVRLAPDKHPAFDTYYVNHGDPELRRFEAFFLDSHLQLSGDLPAHGKPADLPRH